MNLKPIGQFLAGVTRSAILKERLMALLGISLYRNAVYMILKSMITSIMAFVFWILVARLYSTEDVGLASAAIAAATLLAMLSTLGLGFGLIRFLPSSGDKSNAMINFSFTIGGFLSIVTALIFLAGLGVWSPALIFLRQNPLLFCGFIALVAALTLYVLLERTFVAERRAGFILAQGIVFSLLRLIPVVPLAAFFGVSGILAPYGIGAILTVAVFMYLFLPRVQAGYRPRFTIKIEGGTASKMLRFSYTNYVSNLFWAVPTVILPILVLKLLGAEANAYFYIAWAIGSMLFAISLGTSFSLFAEGSYDETKLSEDVRRILKLSFLVLTPAIVLVFLIGDKILLIFGAEYSENATTLLWMLAVSAVPMSLNRIYFSIKRVEMKMKIVMGLTALISILTLALSYILLPQMGILGVGVAWLTSQGLVTMLIMRDLLQKLTSVKSKPIL